VISERESGGHERLSASTPSLPSSPIRHSAKKLNKKMNITFAECLRSSTRQSFLKKGKKNFTECSGSGTRQSINQKKNVCRVLARAALGKEIILQNQRARYKK